MLRFAASPTGDMHIGDLRVALLNYIVSKQRNEELIVRIEDRNKKKNIEGKDQEILDILALFGVEYSQVIYQSQNVRFHSAMALQLIHEKRAFSCFCSPEWIGNKQEEAQKTNKEYMYDDACRNLPAELVIDNTNPFTIRINKPDETLVLKDVIKGNINFEPNTIDSFHIMNQDKTPTYNFACAVDDMLNDISIIIHSEDKLSDTAKQQHVRDSLDYAKSVEYAHLPIILNENSISVKELLEAGYLPEAIANYAIAIGNQPTEEIFNLKDALEWFSLDTLLSSPTSFDIEVLKQINREHLKSMDAKELSRYVGFADAEIGELARIYLDKAATTKELKSKIAPIFALRDIPEDFKTQTALMAQTIKSAPYFENYDEFKNHIMRESGLEGENFLKPLRILLTNAEDGPDVAEIYKHLKNYMGEIVK